MTYHRSCFALTLDAIGNLARWRTGVRPEGRRGTLLLSLPIVLATIAPTETAAGEGCRNRLTIAAALATSPPEQAWHATANGTAALTESHTQSETRCITTVTGTYCVRTQTVETSMNDVRTDYFFVGTDHDKTALIENGPGWLPSKDYVDLWQVRSEVIRSAAIQGEPTSTGRSKLSDRNGESLALRINSALNEFADFSAQPPVNNWLPPYQSGLLPEPIHLAATPRYRSLDFAVSGAAFEKTETLVTRVSATGGPANGPLRWSLLGGASGDDAATPERNVSTVAPLEGNGLLRAPLGGANDYERRLRTFGNYIPPTPRPAPNK